MTFSWRFNCWLSITWSPLPRDGERYRTACDEGMNAESRLRWVKTNLETFIETSPQIEGAKQSPLTDRLTNKQTGLQTDASRNWLKNRSDGFQGFEATKTTKASKSILTSQKAAPSKMKPEFSSNPFFLSQIHHNFLWRETNGIFVSWRRHLFLRQDRRYFLRRLFYVALSASFFHHAFWVSYPLCHINVFVDASVRNASL